MAADEKAAGWERVASECSLPTFDLEEASPQLAQAVLAHARDRKQWQRYAERLLLKAEAR